MLEGYRRISLPRLGGLVSCLPPQQLPLGIASQCEDCAFTPSTVKSREGIRQLWPLASDVLGLESFVFQGAHDERLLLTYDSQGNLYKEVATPEHLELISADLPYGAIMMGTQAYSRAYLAFSNLIRGAAKPRQYYKHTDEQYYLDYLSTPLQTLPATASQSTFGGNCGTGTRYGVVLFQTRTGYISGMSSDAVFSVTSTDAGKQILVENIPIGPENTVRRIVAFTEAGLSSAGPFFYIPLPVIIDGLLPQGATVVDDNVTTSANFNFIDQVLVSSLEVTQYFDKIALDKVMGVTFLPSLKRLAYWGMPTQPSIVYFSDPDDPETVFGTTSLVSVSENDGQRIQSVFEHRGEIYVAKERSGHTVLVTDGTPSTWNVDRRWKDVGPCGPLAIDVCEEFVAFAHRSGLYRYAGGSPEWLSWEQSGSDGAWAAGAWTESVSVTIDTETKRIFVAFPNVAPSQSSIAPVNNF